MAIGVAIEIALAEIVAKDRVIESRIECDGFMNSAMQESLVNESLVNDARQRRLQESILVRSTGRSSLRRTIHKRHAIERNLVYGILMAKTMTGLG